jgi:serralysin
MALTKPIRPISSDTRKNQDVDGVLSGKAWDAKSLPGGVITYSFPDLASDYGKGYSEASRGFEEFTPAQQSAITSIFDSIASFTLATFKDITYFDEGRAQRNPNDKTALLRFGETDKTLEAWSYYPSEKANGGDAWFNNSLDLFEAPAVGTYAYTTFMHEVGHTLGLKHSFENGSFGTVPRDSLEYTVMSYSSYEGARDWLNDTHDFPQTLMMYDIAALQRMYGADLSKNAGHTRYTWDPSDGSLTTAEGKQSEVVFDAPETEVIFMTVWDGGGTDTYDFSEFTTSLRIDLRPGEWVKTFDNSNTADLDGAEGSIYADGIVANALTVKTYDSGGNVLFDDPASLIEKAIAGSGNDELVANATLNSLSGGAGTDTFIWTSLADVRNSTVPSPTWDTITDFADGDRIDLSNIEDLIFTEVSLSRDGNQILLDPDANGVADGRINVSGSFDLAAHWTAPTWLIV